MSSVGISKHCISKRVDEIWHRGFFALELLSNLSHLQQCIGMDKNGEVPLRPVSGRNISTDSIASRV